MSDTKRADNSRKGCEEDRIVLYCLMIEKAHQDVFNILLQVLEDGRLTDGLGRSVNFQNTVIIMTSNLGTQIFKNKSVLGFQQEEKNAYENMHERILEQVRHKFKPEFLNRLDETIIFHSLTRNTVSNCRY